MFGNHYIFTKQHTRYNIQIQKTDKIQLLTFFLKLIVKYKCIRGIYLIVFQSKMNSKVLEE